jgi:hypothetical protein
MKRRVAVPLTKGNAAEAAATYEKSGNALTAPVRRLPTGPLGAAIRLFCFSACVNHG